MTAMSAPPAVDVPFLPGERAPLTPRQVEVLTAYVEHESADLGAHALGMSKWTFKNHMSQIHAQTKTLSTLGTLKALGWLRLP